MIDYIEPTINVGITIDDPNGPERYREGVKHSVHFEVSPNHTTTISLTDDELVNLALVAWARVCKVNKEVT